MRRIVTLAALVLLLIAARPADAQSPSMDDRLDALEAKVAELQNIVYGTVPLPPPMADQLIFSGDLVLWNGALPADRAFRLWCKQFDPSGFGNPNLIGLQCGWTPGP